MEIYLSIYLSICLPTYLPTYLPSYLLINRLPIYLIEGARLEPAHRCGGALLERWTALGLNDVLWIRLHLQPLAQIVHVDVVCSGGLSEECGVSVYPPLKSTEAGTATALLES